MDEAASLPAGQELVEGRPYMRDAKGRLTPIVLVRPADLLKDEIVRDMIARARDESARLRRFRDTAFDEVDILMQLLADKYGAKIGGERGNVEIQSYDGTMRVSVQRADLITFGPELQIAKTLVDECLNEWGAESCAEIRAIVQNAFDVDQQHKVNRGALLGLKRLDITDPRWVRAMQAITDSITVTGSKRYLRFHTRPNPQSAWRAVSLDAATA